MEGYLHHDALPENVRAGRQNQGMIETLRNIEIFRGLKEGQSELLIRNFSVVRPRKGETVFFQTDESTDLYVVFAGAVRVSLVNTDGQELILASFAKGDFFGEISFLDGKPRSATITAEEDSVLGMLGREKFLLFVRDDPTIALGLLSTLLQRLRTADDMIESFAFLEVDRRLLKLLLRTAGEKGQKTGKGEYVIKKITHRELAAKIGSSREAVSKALKSLAARGIVWEQGGYFMISPDEKKGGAGQR